MCSYHAGNIAEPPKWVQRAGLHGLYRVGQDPRRLWKRFILLPPVFLGLLGLQLVGLCRIDDSVDEEPRPIRHA